MGTRYFQFLAGERKGEILIFDKVEQDDDMNFVTFKDGSRCNEELILPLNETAYEGKLMAEISDTNNAWKFKEEWVGREEERWEKNQDGEVVCVQPFIPGRKKTIVFPPRKTKSNFSSQLTNIQLQNQQPIQQKTLSTNDPVWIMLDKSKKQDIIVPMELTISIPSKSLYNVAKESFENGSIKVIDYIIDNLDDKKLKASLRNALLSAYECDVQINNIETLEEPIIGDPKIKESYE